MKEKQRRKFSGKEKVAILKRRLISNELVSDRCDELNIPSNPFYRRKKELFENGDKVFERKGNV